MRRLQDDTPRSLHFAMPLHFWTLALLDGVYGGEGVCTLISLWFSGLCVLRQFCVCHCAQVHSVPKSEEFDASRAKETLPGRVECEA